MWYCSLQWICVKFVVPFTRTHHHHHWLFDIRSLGLSSLQKESYNRTHYRYYFRRGIDGLNCISLNKRKSVKENWNKFPKTVKRSWIKQVTTVTELNYLLEQDTFLHHYFCRVIYTSNSSHPAKHYIYNTKFCLSQSGRHNFIISWSIWLLHVSSEESHFHFWAHILLCGIPKAIVLRSHCQFVKDHGIFTFRALLQIFTHHFVLCQYLIGQWASRPFGL